MKIKNNKILNKATLSSLKTLLDKDLDILLSWKLRKFAKAVEEKLTLLNEEKNKIINKYGEEIDGKKMLKPSNKKGMKALEKLLNIEEEYPDLKIKLKKLKGIKMKPNDLMAIDFLIEE
jgi:hypothetical protein